MPRGTLSPLTPAPLPRSTGGEGSSPTSTNGATAHGHLATPPFDLTSAAECASDYPFWIQTEYLLWHVTNAPLPIPIVTTGDPNVGFDPNLADTVNTAGALGQPGTQALLGGGNFRFPALSGVRLTLGGWISPDQRLGIEGNAFLLERACHRFSAASNSTGSPPLYFPIFSGIAGGERGIPVADPLRGFSGDVNVNSSLQFWGAEANFTGTIYREAGSDFAVLVGFRYADLRERLQINNTTKDLLFGNVATLNDSFQTSNQFYGAQIGGRLSTQWDFISLSLTGKVALGSAHQFVNIQGDITQFGPNPLVPPGLGTFPGGLYAQATNIGRRNANPFSVPFMFLPSVEIKLGFQLNDRLRAFAGYDLIYLTHVLRPGNQIDHNVNLSQNVVLDPSGTGALVGPAQPAPLFNRSDFWAQGMNLGLEFRF
jgi:hypothetical protein